MVSTLNMFNLFMLVGNLKFHEAWDVRVRHLVGNSREIWDEVKHNRNFDYIWKQPHDASGLLLLIRISITLQKLFQGQLEL
jgi:hypothetical protein